MTHSHGPVGRSPLGLVSKAGKASSSQMTLPGLDSVSAGYRKPELWIPEEGIRGKPGPCQPVDRSDQRGRPGKGVALTLEARLALLVLSSWSTQWRALQPRSLSALTTSHLHTAYNHSYLRMASSELSDKPQVMSDTPLRV